MIVTKNPYTQEKILKYKEFSKKDIDALLNEVHFSFSKWKAYTFYERSLILKRISELLKKKKIDLSKLMAEEMGKPLDQGEKEIEKCIWVCKYYAENAESFLKEITIDTDAKKSWVTYEPLGLILAIMPWNYPFWQVFRFLAPTLMAGNVAVLKHAQSVMGCAEAIEEIVLEASDNLPIFKNLVIKSDKVDEVIKHPLVKAITLTGSEKAGKIVAETAGSVLKKLVLELGGNNTFVVFDDADLKKAAKLGVQARMQNSGQSCIAAKRFLVHESIQDEYLKLYEEEMKKMTVGNPFDLPKMGPMSSADLAEELEKQVEKSVKSGAKIYSGGKRDEAVYEPTILINVKPGMPAFDEELFGPVASFVTFSTIEEALKLINNSKYGLGATICTQNEDLAIELGKEIEDGAVFINELVKSDPRLPFGGTKNSGYGRELSKYGIREFTNLKTWYLK